MSKIFVFIVYYFVFHNMLFASAKISKVAQKKLFDGNNFRKDIFLFYKMLPNNRSCIFTMNFPLSCNGKN